LLGVMYALLGLPAAGLLVLGRVGVFPGLLKLAGELSQKGLRGVWGVFRERRSGQGRARQLLEGEGDGRRARLLGLCWVDWTGTGVSAVAVVARGRRQ
jgi:hypothetical protein